MAYAPGNVFTGARARFTINGKLVAYATQVSGSDEIIYDGLEVLDNFQVVEFVPLGYRVNFSAGRTRLIGSSADSHGSLRGIMEAFPKLGKSAADHLRNTLNQADMSCQIDDTKSELIFMLLEGVKIASRSFSIQPRGIVNEEIGFVGIRMFDEAEAA